MKLIRINADERKVEVLDNIEPNSEDKSLDLHTCYDLIGNGCDVIECIHIGGGVDMIIDEEGRLREQKAGFHIGSIGLDIAGNAILTTTFWSDDDGGKWIGFDLASEEFIDYVKGKLEAGIEWLDLKDNPLEPSFGIYTF